VARVALVDRRQRGEVALDRTLKLVGIGGALRRDDPQGALPARTLARPPRVGADALLNPRPFRRDEKDDRSGEQDEGDRAHSRRILPPAPEVSPRGGRFRTWHTETPLYRRLALVILLPLVTVTAACGRGSSGPGAT